MYLVRREFVFLSQRCNASLKIVSLGRMRKSLLVILPVPTWIDIRVKNTEVNNIYLFAKSINPIHVPYLPALKPSENKSKQIRQIQSINFMPLRVDA